jgi:hypothetical protein
VNLSRGRYFDARLFFRIPKTGWVFPLSSASSYETNGIER